MRILWLAPYAPWPPTHGGKIRLYNLARAMVRLGHTVEIWCVADELADWPAPRPDRLTLRSFRARRRTSTVDKLAALVSPLPAAAWSTSVPTVLDALDRMPASMFDVAVMEQAHLGGLGAALGRRGLPWVLDAQNVESSLLTQIARRADRATTRWLLRIDARKFRRLERKLLDAASGVVAVSDVDRQRLQAIRARPDIAIHPNGVDLDFYAWKEHSRSGTRLLMTGTLGYRPNLDACLWLRQEIMPAIRARLPNASLTLVGGGVVPQIQALHDPRAGFEIVGPVPDVRPYLAAADAFIVPLRIGGGTRLKALEALAAGLPVIGTPLAVEGLGLIERGLVLTGQRPAELAGAAVEGLTDPATRSRLSAAGRAFVEATYDWRRIATGLEETLDRVAQRRGSGTPGYGPPPLDVNQA